MIRGPSRVLVVDDEDAILDFLEMGLRQQGFVVESARDGTTARALFDTFGPDLIILDLMLPDTDGLTLCKQFRASSTIPILMLTARGTLEDTVEGLESGADDYVIKPFRFKELLARVCALLRRAGAPPGPQLCFLDVRLDRASRTVTRGDATVSLTPREFDLLEYMLQRPRAALTREELLAHLWGEHFDGASNVVEVYVRTLRQKLGDESRTLIRSVRGVGYMLGG